MDRSDVLTAKHKALKKAGAAFSESENKGELLNDSGSASETQASFERIVTGALNSCSTN